MARSSGFGVELALFEFLAGWWEAFELVAFDGFLLFALVAILGNACEGVGPATRDTLLLEEGAAGGGIFRGNFLSR